LAYVTLAEQDNQSITATSTTYFISLNYNGGSPTITLSESNPYIADQRNIPIGKVMKNTTGSVHYISGGFNFQDGIFALHRRAGSLREHELESGSVISYIGTNNFAMTSGAAYAGINRVVVSSYNSTTTPFRTVYADGSSGWTDTATSTTIDFEHYDDGDGILGDVGNAKYGVFWVYKHMGDQHVYVRYGTEGDYSLAEAEVVDEPAKPDHLTDFGLLIGKIIVSQSGGSFEVQMVTDIMFSGTAVGDHNQLSTLQGGTTDQYYHLNSSEHTELTAWLDDVTLVDGGATVLATTTITKIIVSGDTTLNTGWTGVLRVDSGVVSTTTSAGSGDVLSVGDCLEGICLDGTSDGGTYITFYNIDSNKTQLIASDTASDLVITLPATTGTLVYEGGTGGLDWTSSVGTIHTDNYIENVSTALEIGATNANTISITSDGGADDVTIPAAVNGTAGLLTDAKWDEIVANTYSYGRRNWLNGFNNNCYNFSCLGWENYR